MERQSTSTQITQVGILHSPIVTQHYRTAFATDIGLRRSQNQDNLSVAPELGLFIVADGMGGHQGGETASAMAAEVTARVVEEGIRGATGGEWDATQLITNAIRTASTAIFQRSQQSPHLHGMGTTTTALLAQGKNLTIGHVGDSRAYLFRRESNAENYSIWQLTRDHSLVQEKLRAGLITREEIKTDRMKNVITRSVGFESQIQVETYHIEICAGDLFLICSDGLSGPVADSQLLEIISEHYPKSGSDQITESDPALKLDKTVQDLISAANRNGGDDNITAVMIEIL